MKIKLKISNIILFLWGIVLASEILFFTDIPIHSTFIYYSSSLVLILFLTYYLIKYSPKKSNSLYFLYLFLFLFTVFLFGCILANPIYAKEIRDNNYLMIIFYILVFLMGNYIYQSELRFQFVKTTYIVLVVIIIMMMFRHFSEIDSQMLFRNMFSGFKRGRISLGFSHPNFLGNTSLCAIIISYFYTKMNSSTKKILLIKCLNILLIYIILITASRTSFIGLILFMILNYLSVFADKINKKIKIILEASVLIISFLFLLSVNNIELTNFLELTNRSENFIYNIPVLIKNNRLWYGLAYVGSGDFISKVSGTFFVDNYILYTLMSSGIIGFIFNMSFVMILWRTLAIAAKSSHENKIILIIFFVNFFISFAENCFLTPSFPSCFVYTILYLSIFSERFEKNSISFSNNSD